MYIYSTWIRKHNRKLAIDVEIVLAYNRRSIFPSRWSEASWFFKYSRIFISEEDAY